MNFYVRCFGMQFGDQIIKIPWSFYENQESAGVLIDRKESHVVVSVLTHYDFLLEFFDWASLLLLIERELPKYAVFLVFT